MSFLCSMCCCCWDSHSSGEETGVHQVDLQPFVVTESAVLLSRVKSVTSLKLVCSPGGEQGSGKVGALRKHVL